MSKKETKKKTGAYLIDKATVADENLELNYLTVAIDIPAKHAFMKKAYEDFPCL